MRMSRRSREVRLRRTATGSQSVGWAPPRRGRSHLISRRRRRSHLKPRERQVAFPRRNGRRIDRRRVGDGNAETTGFFGGSVPCRQSFCCGGSRTHAVTADGVSTQRTRPRSRSARRHPGTGYSKAHQSHPERMPPLLNKAHRRWSINGQPARAMNLINAVVPCYRKSTRWAHDTTITGH